MYVFNVTLQIDKRFTIITEPSGVQFWTLVHVWATALIYN